MAEFNRVEWVFIMLLATDKFVIYQTQNKPDYHGGLFQCPRLKGEPFDVPIFIYDLAEFEFKYIEGKLSLIKQSCN